jgi:uridine kinase
MWHHRRTKESNNVMSDLLQQLIERVKAAPSRSAMTTRVIAIDGPGGSGKSTLAEHLSAALGSVPIVHTDDFASWETPLEWWPRLLIQVLEPLSGNRTARYQRYDWVTRTPAEWRDLPPTRYVILEGVSASRRAFRPFLSYTVWVETPRQERLRRGLERDGVEASERWVAWMAEEDVYIETEHPAEKADIVIRGTDAYCDRISLNVAAVERSLASGE